MGFPKEMNKRTAQLGPNGSPPPRRWRRQVRCKHTYASIGGVLQCFVRDYEGVCSEHAGGWLVDPALRHGLDRAAHLREDPVHELRRLYAEVQSGGLRAPDGADAQPYLHVATLTSSFPSVGGLVGSWAGYWTLACQQPA